MAKADETKRNSSSDLDDDIFAILNSTRPTYPGGGPNEQKPATQLNRRAVSQPNQPTQPQTNRPLQQTPVRPAAAPQQQPTPTQAVPPVSNPTAAPQPEQPPVQQPRPRQGMHGGQLSSRTVRSSRLLRKNRCPVCKSVRSYRMQCRSRRTGT